MSIFLSFLLAFSLKPVPCVAFHFIKTVYMTFKKCFTLVKTCNWWHNLHFIQFPKYITERENNSSFPVFQLQWYSKCCNNLSTGHFPSIWVFTVFAMTLYTILAYLYLYYLYLYQYLYVYLYIHIYLPMRNVLFIQRNVIQTDNEYPLYASCT